MRGRGWKCLILCALSFVCTGCWDGLDVERRAIVTLAGIDVVPSADGTTPRFLYSAQIARPSVLGGGDKSAPTGSNKNFFVMEGTGGTISAAQEETQRNLPRRFFLGHRRLLIIGETLAKQGVSSTMDEVVRNSQSRLRTYILITRNADANDIVKLPYPISRLPSDALWEMERTGDAVKVDAAEFAEMMLDERDPYAMGAQVTTDVSGNPTFQLKDVALFRDDKLVGWLTDNQAEGLAWLVGHLRSNTVDVQVPNHPGVVSSRMTRIHMHIQPVVRRNTAQMVVTATAVDDIVENGTDLNLSAPADVAKVKTLVNKATRDEINSTIEVLKKYEVDPVGFGRIIHQRFPNQWDHMKPHWREMLKTLPVTVNVHVEIDRTGKIGPPIFGKSGDIRANVE